MPQKDEYFNESSRCSKESGNSTPNTAAVAMNNLVRTTSLIDIAVICCNELSVNESVTVIPKVASPSVINSVTKMT